MQRGASTHLFLPQRLSTAHLDLLARAGAHVVEVFASRHHFDYTDRAAVREIASWFRANNATPTLHMPLFTPDEEAQWSRHTEPTLNLLDESKAARIAAMDEVKRALEAGEQIPFRSCVLHLGTRDSVWSTRALDDALTAIEHLKAFAGPLGIRLLLENLQNPVATPAHLAEIIRVGHFQTVGFCLDTGHAQLAESIPETRDHEGKSGLDLAFEIFGAALAELHLHDNNSTRDEHLWPGEGGIAWPAVARHLRLLESATAIAGATPSQPIAGVLEIAYDLDAANASTDARLAEKFRRAWDVVEAADAPR